MGRDKVFVVIGSNCFSGAHMVDELLKDPSNSVVGISRSPEKSPLYLPYKSGNSKKKFKFYQVDMLRDHDKLISLLDLIRPEYIINFAALSEVAVSNFRPLDYFQTNCVSLVNLCNQLRTREYLKKFIQISTAEVYGSCLKEVTERSCPNPTTPYAVSKLAADHYLLSLFKVFKFPAILVRSTNVYGVHQQLFKVIPRTAIFLRTGRKIELHGDGQVMRCFLHIRDLVKGVVRVVEAGEAGEIYHFSVKDETTISEVIRKMCELLKFDYESNVVPVESRPGSDLKYLLDYSWSAKKLNWAPQINLEQGMKEVIQWVDNNWEEVLNEPHIYIHRP